MLNIIHNTISYLHNLIWEDILIYLLLSAGIFFTFRTGAMQITGFGKAIRAMKNSRSTDTKSNVSAFQAFCTSLAARIGTGNLAGVAIALTLGGPGALFWMWVVALLGMSTALIENILAQLYKIDNKDGTFRGGPAYYIEKALGQRWLGIIFSFAMILSFGIAFNSVQSNTIAGAMSSYNIKANYVGIFLAVSSGILIFGGLRSIVKFAEVTVPFMALAYIFIALAIVIINVEKLPSVMSLIFNSAFTFKNAGAGTLGAIMSPAILQGVKRGMFSNEAGMGSAPNAAATAYSLHPVNQGLLGMIGVFVDTVLVCSATGFIIILSGTLDAATGATGIELTQLALETHVGGWGKHLISVAIFLFAFTSIIANYYYAESSVRFITDNKNIIMTYRVITISVIYLGAVSGLKSVWGFADLSMGIMAIINLVSIFILNKAAIAVLNDYKEQLKYTNRPTFHKISIKEKYAANISKDVWN